MALDQKQAELVEVTTKLTQAEKRLTNAKDAYNAWRTASTEAIITAFKDALQKRDGGHCAREFSNKSKRRDCQAKINALVAQLAPRYSEVIARRRATQVELDTAESLVGNLTSQKKSLETQIDSLSQSNIDLAKIGKTAESVAIEAQTQSAIEMKRATLDESKRKNIQLIALIGGLMLLAVLGIILYRKYVKK